MVSFAFLCHQNLFPIYLELHNPTEYRVGTVTGVAMVCCGVVYACTGFAGYYLFRDATASNLLKNFPVEGSTADTVMVRHCHPLVFLCLPSTNPHLSLKFIQDIVRVGFAMSFVLSFPLILWEAREGVEELFFSSWLERPVNILGRAYSSSGLRRHAINISIVSVCTAVGIIVPTITQVLTFVGATTSPMMVFILPPLFFLKVDGSEYDGVQSGWKIPSQVEEQGCCARLTPRRMWAYGILAWGLAVMPLALIAAVHDMHTTK